MGLALLLLEAPASQQTALLSLGNSFPLTHTQTNYLRTPHSTVFLFLLKSFCSIFVSPEALTLAPPESERTPWGTPVLVLPLLQVVSCSVVMEPLTDPGTYSQKQSLAQSLLQSTQQETLMPAEVLQPPLRWAQNLRSVFPIH